MSVIHPNETNPSFMSAFSLASSGLDLVQRDTLASVANSG